MSEGHLLDELAGPTLAEDANVAATLTLHPPVEGGETVASTPPMFVPVQLVEPSNGAKPANTNDHDNNSKIDTSTPPTPKFVPVELLQVPKPTPLQFVPIDLTIESTTVVTGDVEVLPAPGRATGDVLEMDLPMKSTTFRATPHDKAMLVDDVLPSTMDHAMIDDAFISRKPSEESLEGTSLAPIDALPSTTQQQGSGFPSQPSPQPTPVSSTKVSSDEKEGGNNEVAPPSLLNDFNNAIQTTPMFIPVDLLDMPKATPLQFVPVDVTAESLAKLEHGSPLDRASGRLSDHCTPQTTETSRATRHQTAISADETLPRTMEGRGGIHDDDDDADSIADDDVEIAAILKEAASITDLAIQQGRLEAFRGGFASSSLRQRTDNTSLLPASVLVVEQPPQQPMFVPVDLHTPKSTTETPLLYPSSTQQQLLRVDTNQRRTHSQDLAAAPSSHATTPTYSDESGTESTPSTPTAGTQGGRTRQRTPRAAAGRPTSDNIQTISTVKRIAKHNSKVAHIVAHIQKKAAVVQSPPTTTAPLMIAKPERATPPPVAGNSSKSTPTNSHASNRKAVSATQFAKLSDTKHCRFYPQKSKASVAAMRNPACGYDFVHRGQADDDDDNEGHGSSGRDFLNRMEVAEQNRRKKLDTTRGEEAYMLRQNKKECPKCGMVQSYAEYRDKKKRCTFCGVLFALPKVVKPRINCTYNRRGGTWARRSYGGWRMSCSNGKSTAWRC
ncbi:hypothetical protein, variant 1 [Aphanomyces astaci]|uniref:Uncharacterized protein n=1 Tax=Aphanomyces astaci TaxID=112090 RepID=W4G199_APHAT|nr:hypothetical protein, variant 1 [Aphanomyces astaci]ETV72698.1 hypothetical protein, variant 1 [Aphanomyces astaci]|eukprot:XP_009837926.1 hypothetical protein, variant 1 [Aphanomyces astaci]